MSESVRCTRVSFAVSVPGTDSACLSGVPLMLPGMKLFSIGRHVSRYYGFLFSGTSLECITWSVLQLTK
jgi:hypothetical protein